MFVRPRALGPTLVAAAIVLAGCGQTGAPTAPVAAAVAKTAKAAAAQPQVQADLALATDGRVEVRVGGLAARKLMATVAQVASITITLSGGPLATPRVLNVSAAALAAGKGTVAFDAVPNGTVAVAIEALDAAGVKIGEKATSAVVQRGQTAVVAVSLKLQDTHVASENGNLAFDLEVQDGTVVFDPIVSPSPRPSSPVLQPTPTPAPGTFTISEEASTWYADGTIKHTGRVRNAAGSARATQVTVTFTAKGVFGPRVVETIVVDLGNLGAGATARFTATSTKSVKSLFGKGTAEAVVGEP